MYYVVGIFYLYFIYLEMILRLRSIKKVGNVGENIVYKNL